MEPIARRHEARELIGSTRQAKFYLPMLLAHTDANSDNVRLSQKLVAG